MFKSLVNEAFNLVLEEAKKDENQKRIKSTVIDPVIEYIFQQLYPYIFITVIFFLLMIILSFLIIYIMIFYH